MLVEQRPHEPDFLSAQKAEHAWYSPILTGTSRNSAVLGTLKLGGWLAFPAGSKVYHRGEVPVASVPAPPKPMSDESPIEPVHMHIGDVFDLHSVPPRDVTAVVEEYLLEARRLGFKALRIVHGRGIGVQREAVRGVLARTPFVKHFTDAPLEAGGWGATVVTLE